MAEQLAIEGGQPVRRGRLPYDKGAGLIGAEERAAVLEVLDGRGLFRYGAGSAGRVERFEAAFAAAIGAPHAVAVSSGTAALRCALAALGIGPGDEVVIPAYTFIATVNAVVVSGALPVFAEVDESLCLDPHDLAGRVTERTAAVIPVHLENVAADMASIVDSASTAGIAVLEDAAQAMGVSYRGRRVGTIGEIGAFSLQLSKNITTGEGGVIATSDADLYLRAARYQDQGGQFVTQHGRRGMELGEPFIGENLRMTEIAGAIAEVQLTRLDGVVAALRTNYERVRDGIGVIDGLVPRALPDPDGIVGSSLCWFAPDRETARRFIASLRAEGVPALQMYDAEPVYAAPAILARRTATQKGHPWNAGPLPPSADYRLGMCPRSEDLFARSIMIGIGPAFTLEDCDAVAHAVRKVATHYLGATG